MSVNPFGGPSSLTIIQLGAKYVPCMKPDPTVQTDFFMPCNPKYPKNGVKSLNGTCLYYDNLAFICGMGGFSQRDKPDQIWRFITAIFMHTGLIHLALNMMLQIYVGKSLFNLFEYLIDVLKRYRWNETWGHFDLPWST